MAPSIIPYDVATKTTRFNFSCHGHCMGLQLLGQQFTIDRIDECNAFFSKSIILNPTSIRI